MKTYARIVKFCFMVLFFAGLAFSDVIETSSSEKYAADVSSKKGLVNCIKEDVGSIQEKFAFRKAVRGPVVVKIDSKDILEMIPPTAKPVMDMPRMVGTLQPETCYTVPESKDKK